MRTMRRVRQNASVCVKQNPSSGSLGMKSLNGVALSQTVCCHHVKPLLFELKWKWYFRKIHCIKTVGYRRLTYRGRNYIKRNRS